MKAIRFERQDSIYGMDQRFKPLPVRTHKTADGTTMLTSCWVPSPEERDQIAEGKPIFLHVLSEEQPPCKLTMNDDGN